jgi:hypothetical protein
MQHHLKLRKSSMCLQQSVTETANDYDEDYESDDDKMWNEQYDSDSDDELPRLSLAKRPQLKLRPIHANHVKDIVSLEEMDDLSVKSVNNDPNQGILDQFASYPYMDYGEVCIFGYIRQNAECEFRINVPKDITDLCKRYSFVYEDALFQIKNEISNVLKMVNKKLVTIKLLTVIIAKYLSTGYLSKGLKHNLKDKQITFYVQELIRLKYIVAVNLNVNQYIDTILPNRSNQFNQLYRINID